MKIVIETIPHSEQRYDTVGDWQFGFDRDPAFSYPDHLFIQVSKFDGFQAWKYEALVAVHELIEALTCKAAGITTDEVDKFDKSWTGIYKLNETGYTEPGEDPKAPYYHQHQFASGIERMLAAELNINWTEYEDDCNNFDYSPAVKFEQQIITCDICQRTMTIGSNNIGLTVFGITCERKDCPGRVKA